MLVHFLLGCAVVLWEPQNGLIAAVALAFSQRNLVGRCATLFAHLQIFLTSTISIARLPQLSGLAVGLLPVKAPAQARCFWQRKKVKPSQASRERKDLRAAVGPSMVKYKPWPAMEKTVADIIGVHPMEIWPSRYKADGSPVGIGIRKKRSA